MSASEKLKRLEASMNPQVSWIAYSNQLHTLREALPQIRALVEAAEKIPPFLRAYSEDADAQGFQTEASDAHQAHEAFVQLLSALDEALT